MSLPEEYRTCNICFALSALDIGGVQRVNSYLVNSLFDQGYKVVLVKTNSSKSDFYEVTAPYWHRGNEFIFFLRRVFRKIGKILHLQVFRSINPDVEVLEQYLREYDPKTVVLNPDFLLSVKMLKRKFPDINFICWMHNAFEVYVNNYFSGHAKELFDNVAQADGVICLEAHTAKMWQQYNDNVVVIHNPATLGVVQRQSKLDAHVISFTSRLAIEHKGLDILIEVARRLPDDWSIRVAGDGPDRQKFQDMILDSNLESKVVLAGALEGEDLCRHYRESSIFLSTSRWEGFSLVAVEAMSFGLPIVGPDIPSINEITEDGRYGLLAEVENSDDFIEKITGLINDKEKRGEYSKRSLQRVKAFSVDTIAKQWITFLESLSSKNVKIKGTSNEI
ncbi:glycosyltransferase [Bifidobacterium tibiigranuli]|uniref:glycosyltransferase n=1 Tax=Bifidobacterium tibiigranuli TaxID=2172043 RepID=UPI0026EE50C3|nr:glycosyltransferase [Bifidobacterium tibiigranuli]MCI1713970.1 glycosyltransferase [Bifidobacterium tibiigranuli]